MKLHSERVELVKNGGSSFGANALQRSPIKTIEAPLGKLVKIEQTRLRSGRQDPEVLIPHHAAI